MGIGTQRSGCHSCSLRVVVLAPSFVVATGGDAAAPEVDTFPGLAVHVGFAYERIRLAGPCRASEGPDVHDLGFDSSKGLVAGDIAAGWRRRAIENIYRVLHSIFPETDGGVACHQVCSDAFHN
jgi:hypothetical protein